MGKVALITGITGQDGSYLAEFLLGKGYEVHGIIRRASLFNTGRIDHIYSDQHNPDVKLKLHYGDMTDHASLTKIVAETKPDEIYNLAAMSHVRVSFDIPEYTWQTVATGVIGLLEIIRTSGRPIKLYQASSSEMFGSSPPPQNEDTKFRPQSPYAIAKCAAHYAVRNYRDAYGLFGCCGILFNHESPRRGETFVTRKVTQAAAAIKKGTQDKVFMGNLDARRDWGFAGDYVEAMWMMLQRGEPDDYVVATGTSHSVRDFAEIAFSSVGLNFDDHYVMDERYLRPTEVDSLMGDFSKARSKLGWVPRTSFEELAHMMVESDLE